MLTGTHQRLARVNNFIVKAKDAALSRVYQFKYLGVVLDPCLSWNDHVDYIGRKVSAKLGMLRRARKVIPRAACITLYNAMILPIFDYCAVIWDSCDVALKTDNGKYWSRITTGKRFVGLIGATQTSKNDPYTSFRFTVIDGHSDKITIESLSEEAYLCRVSFGSNNFISAIEGDESQNSAQCQFKVYNQTASGKIALLADNGKFLCRVEKSDYPNKIDVIMATKSTLGDDSSDYPCEMEKEVL